MGHYHKTGLILISNFKMRLNITMTVKVTWVKKERNLKT